MTSRLGAGVTDGSGATASAEAAAARRRAERQRRYDMAAVARLRAMRPAERLASILARKPETMERLLALWPAWAHEGQLAPPGEWRTWLLMAGRGFGKTRAGAEWVSALARAEPGLRVALVAGSLHEARAVMVEGASGLLRIGPARDRPRWQDGRGRLVWPSGAQAQIFSGASPELLRGPEHHIAWCDELAKWDRAEESWANLQLGLRLGPWPRAVVTTTPRPLPLLRRLLADPTVIRTGGRTGDNKALSEAWAQDMRRRWEGTRLGRQELDGELVDEVEGSLWPRAVLERCRLFPSRSREGLGEGVLAGPGESSTTPPPTPPMNGRGDLVRIVVGVDPPASKGGDACGIVVVGLDRDANGWVLDDASVAHAGPEEWARAVVGAAARWGADRVVVEANQGGDMVEATLRAVHGGRGLPIRLAHARAGKGARAEPVSALYAAGRMRHAGAFPRLEDELSGMTARGYRGPGRSPDRADALVWAAGELMLGEAEEPPRVRAL